MILCQEKVECDEKDDCYNWEEPGVTKDIVSVQARKIQILYNKMSVSVTN